MHPSRTSGTQSEATGRRRFLKGGIAAGLLAALPPLAGGNRETAIIPGAGTIGLDAVPPFEFDEVTIAELQAGMTSGKYTARSIAAKYVSRIGAIDREGPSLRSVIELNPDADAIAEALDAERKERGLRGPLHGIPVLLKDNIDTADRMATTAGSNALVGARPAADAHLVLRLREAGAVILGKANLSEWANIRSSRSTSGWSARGGLTRNPYALDRNPSGSSSGSAVAVAANLCAAAVGTETDGSIVSPASINGIVGIKPTVGLVSRSGVIPISHTQDTPGPMARTVTDAAILLGALAGADAGDPATSAYSGSGRSGYAAGLDPDGLRGRRIGIARTYFGFLDSVDRLMEGAIATLRAKGAIIVDPVEIPTFKELGDAEMTVLLYELKADVAAYLARRGPDFPLRTLNDVIRFNEENRAVEMAWFGQELFLKADAKGPLTDPEYVAALEKCRRLAGPEGIDAAMEKHGVDALAAPTDGPAWPTDLINGDHYMGGSSTAAAVAGYPAVTVPAGNVFGLPVGISFFGRAWSEESLIRIAFGFEQATGARKPPRFLPTLDLGG